MPEYVCSVNIDVRTEPRSASSFHYETRAGARLAATEAEQQQADALRQWYLSHASGQCRPYWLHGSLFDMTSDTDLVEALNKFNSIDTLLHCQIPADRVRALYPVLFNVPVQNHDELLALATAVAKQIRGAHAWGRPVFKGPAVLGNCCGGGSEAAASLQAALPYQEGTSTFGAAANWTSGVIKSAMRIRPSGSNRVLAPAGKLFRSFWALPQPTDIVPLTSPAKATKSSRRWSADAAQRSTVRTMPDPPGVVSPAFIARDSRGKQPPRRTRGCRRL